jgi:ABC-type polysaccharide/polyol phosphate transport system ATPase subunit
LIPIATGSVRVKQNFMLLRGGIGIQPHLTGRQNVVSAGIYLGLTPAQAKALVPDILEFSELGESFDRPTKYYSDGMLSRLVFAVATSISPEILLLDELLGAGDISFQEKAKRRLDAFLSAARVVVVVTHSIDFVRNNCNKALVMAHGKQLYFGEPSTAVSVYLSHLHLSLGTQQSATRF